MDTGVRNTHRWESLYAGPGHSSCLPLRVVRTGVGGRRRGPWNVGSCCSSTLRSCRHRRFRMRPWAQSRRWRLRRDVGIDISAARRVVELARVVWRITEHESRDNRVERLECRWGLGPPHRHHQPAHEWSSRRPLLWARALW